MFMLIFMPLFRTNWLLSRQALAECRKIDRQYVTEEELMRVNIWFAQIITDLGRSLQVRQVIVATAITYFKRFYTKNSFRNTEPNLVAATCMYLACKIEESPQHIKAVITDMKTIMQEKGEPFSYDNPKVAEMEFYLLEELNFNMIVYHPYRSLMTLAQDLGTKNEDVHWAWYVINDSYRTDMCLLYPPHVIAAAALYLQIALKGGAQYGDYSLTSMNTANNSSVAGVTTRGAKRGAAAAASNNNNNNNNINTSVNETPKVKDIRLWFAQLNVDLEQIIDIVQEIISLYKLWSEEDKQNEKIRDILNKLLK
ncbi:cyclin-like protein [Glomus cerebriforme]|uniref:Cyclin-like protein n=1 Tax=Glomus cerebriforme TaxID=658196 RepID=A0A397TM80_9GLOM|nr:cyclin-like protein [Glomus cerebriforme]